MILIQDKAKCCGCHACQSVCPKHAISMSFDEEGFLYPQVDENLCINCGLCEKVCSFQKDAAPRERIPAAYAAKIKDENIRNQSSSGGIFSVFANRILEKSGAVYGVAMADDLKSAHFIRVDSKDELHRLRGSKYLQATVGDTFRKVKADLDGGKDVLFSGVPCQINGLKCFLQKEYENLLTVEVICHGTPSAALWEKYFDHIEAKYDAKIQTVNFREKRSNGKSFGLSYDGENTSQYLNPTQDPYLRMFIDNVCLRPSCYACQAKQSESMADWTIADFWGIQFIAPQWDDDKGVSLVLVQTEKGAALWDALKNEYDCLPVGFADSIRHNSAYYQSCEKPAGRDTFFSDMKAMSFEELRKKYGNTVKVGFIKKVLRKVKSVLRRILRKNKTSKFEYGLYMQTKKN